MLSLYISNSDRNRRNISRIITVTTLVFFLWASIVHTEATSKLGEPIHGSMVSGLGESNTLQTPFLPKDEVEAKTQTVAPLRTTSPNAKIADTSKYFPVEIIASTPDIVGQRLVFSLKERIKGSSTMTLGYNQSEARMQANIVTLGTSNYGTVYSVAVTFKNPNSGVLAIYLTSLVGLCGSERLKDQADAIAAAISEQCDFVLKAIINSPAQQQQAP